MIDAHAHLISGDTERYPPAPPSGTINPTDFENPMTVERLLREMDATGVERALLVQRGSIYGFDNSYVCDSAARFPDRLAAVCSIDATRHDCAQAVRYWVTERGAVGIRLMELVRGQDIGWLDSPLAREAWGTAAELGVPVCVHLFPWNRKEGLTRLADILEAIPEVQVVIDHLSAMKSDAGPPDHGVDALLERVAAFSGVSVKFTTIPLGRLEASGIATAPILQRVMDLFGADRVLWGSDITQSPGSYAEMVALGRRAVEGFAPEVQQQLLCGSAARVYGLTAR